MGMINGHIAKELMPLQSDTYFKTPLCKWAGSRGTNPADTLRNNDVGIMSKRRHFDVITSNWRFDVITTLLLRHVLSGISEGAKD